MNVPIGYIVAYMYLAIVFILSFCLSKMLNNNEISRNLIHIFAGLGWIIYKVFFPATIHPIIISATLVILTIITRVKKIRFIERANGNYGTIYYTVVMLIMSIIGYKRPFIFDIFGLSILCLALGDAAANIIGSKIGKTRIYKNKSLQGSLTCFIICLVTITVCSQALSQNLGIGDILILTFLSTLTELFSGSFDNLAIPFVVFIYSYILLSTGVDIHFVISVLIGSALAFCAKKIQLLNTPATFMLFCLVTLLFYYGGCRAFIAIMSIFTILIIIEKTIARKTAVVTDLINKESGIRNEIQLAANCLPAVILIIMYGISNNNIFIVAFFAAVAEVVGDSVASDVGVLSKKDPIDICSLKRIPRGLSGGISLLGTGAAVLICIYSGCIYMFLYQGNIYFAITIAFASMSGVVLDSILGSTVQARYKCVICNKYTEKNIHCEEVTALTKGIAFIDNSKVNLACNIFSSCLASSIIILLG